MTNTLFGWSAIIRAVVFGIMLFMIPIALLFIAAMDRVRWSVTFRSLREGKGTTLLTNASD